MSTLTVLELFLNFVIAIFVGFGVAMILKSFYEKIKKNKKKSV